LLLAGTVDGSVDLILELPEKSSSIPMPKQHVDIASLGFRKVATAAP
jgi:hypothetical protein